MGAEMTSRGFTQPGPLNHGEVQAAASATSAAFHLVSAVDRGRLRMALRRVSRRPTFDPPLNFAVAAPVLLDLALNGPLSGAEMADGAASG